MVKFGRKFFFDKVYTKKNYTIPIIIAVVLIVAITATFFITRFFKKNETKNTEPQVTFNEFVEIGILDKLPSPDAYFKKLENIKVEDFEIVYPENLEMIEDLSECEEFESITECKQEYASSLGEYQIIIKSEKLNNKENTVILKVVDKEAPYVETKDVTITEGETYKIADFVKTCTDNSRTECIYEFKSDDVDEAGNIIDYSKFTTPGEYKIKLLAKDTSDNKSEFVEAKLIINKKKTPTNDNKDNNKDNETSKPKTCEYGNLRFSDSYVLAVRVNNTDCAISPVEAEDITTEAAQQINKILAKEVQQAYLKKSIEPLGLQGKIIYELTYGPVYNSSNKGVVGYYLMAEAKQTIGDTTTTVARYFIDESGNKVWKVNTLNLK